MAELEKYSLKGSVVGGCNCNWGCPCNFEVAPSKGFCEGEYVWCIEEGKIGDVSVGGLNLGMFFHSPAAIHLGNLTIATFIDEKATHQQREALQALIAGAAPFNVFLELSGNNLGIKYAAFQVELDGIRSKVSIPGVYDLELTPMTNPVTGEPELATLHKPTGFTSQVQELCSTAVERFSTEGLSYDCGGNYGEYAPFEYTGP